MSKYLLAAVLAVFSLPANAVTYLEISATGTASGFYQPYGTPSGTNVAFDGWAIASAIIRLDFFECGWVGQSCLVSGNTVTFKGFPMTNGSFQLIFDHVLTGLPTSADGFVGGRMEGSVSGGYGHANGTLDTLTINVREGDRYTSIYAGVRPNLPEPGTWLMLISGFAVVGAALRRRRYSVAFAG